MPHRHLIGHALTSPSTLDSVGRPRALPDDLLREASRRLAVISLLGAVLWVIATVLAHIAVMAMGAPLTVDATDAISAAAALVSLAGFFYARHSGARDPRLVLDVGLAYMIFTSVALGLTLHWNPLMPHTTVFPMITWIGAVVLMFSAIVPSAPMKMLIASLIAVSMNPLGMLIARSRGTWNVSLVDIVVMHYPDYLLAGVAVVIAHVVTKLGRQVAKAREMGSYQLGELLGRGGMGEVYKATHRMLARPAAIKLIRPEMLRAEGAEAAQVIAQRFRREAEAAAQLRSPHTVELYDFGVTDDGIMYFVMELLDGMDLQSLVRRHGALPAPRAISILRQVCASLEEAHARGLVHRDIKPANIHVGRLGLQHDFVKVLDFGLVKSVAGATPQQSLATAAGLTPGTPAYMAPEIALGEPIDARADLYALGCVAYYLLTGTIVFEAESIFQTIAMALRDEPVPPSQRTANPIPPALERLVLSCLAKKPADRPTGAAELNRRLAEIAVEPWSEELAREWWATAQPAVEAETSPDEEIVLSFSEAATAMMK